MKKFIYTLLLFSLAVAAWGQGSAPASPHRWNKFASDSSRYFTKGTDSTFVTDGGLNYYHVYNVKHYGAVGDSSADDYSAIQSAFDAYSSSGDSGAVFKIPAGVYRLSRPVRVNTDIRKRISIIGDGSATRLIVEDTGGIICSLTAANPPSFGETKVMIRDLEIHNDTSNSTANAYGIKLWGQAVFKIENVIIHGERYLDKGIYLKGSQQGEISYCRIDYTRKFIVLDSTIISVGDTTRSNAVNIYSITGQNSTMKTGGTHTYGIVYEPKGADDGSMFGNHFYGCSTNVDISSNNINLVANHFEASQFGVRVKAGDKTVIDGNWFWTCDTNVYLEGGNYTTVSNNLFNEDLIIGANTSRPSIVYNLFHGTVIDSIADKDSLGIRQWNYGAGNNGSLTLIDSSLFIHSRSGQQRTGIELDGGGDDAAYNPLLTFSRWSGSDTSYWWYGFHVKDSFIFRGANSAPLSTRAWKNIWWVPWGDSTVHFRYVDVDSVLVVDTANVNNLDINTTLQIGGYKMTTADGTDAQVLHYAITGDSTYWGLDDGAGGGEANTIQDTGVYNGTSGFGLSGGKAGVDLHVKGLLEGSNITITTSGDSALSITSSGGTGLWDSVSVVNVDSFYLVGRDADTALFIVMDTLQDTITVDFGQSEGQTIRIRNVNRIDTDTTITDYIQAKSTSSLSLNSGGQNYDIHLYGGVAGDIKFTDDAALRWTMSTGTFGGASGSNIMSEDFYKQAFGVVIPDSILLTTKGIEELIEDSLNEYSLTTYIDTTLDGYPIDTATAGGSNNLDDGDILEWNAANSEWRPTTQSGGGGTSDSMQIDTSGAGVYAKIYSTAGYAFTFREGAGIDYTADNDTVYMAATLGTAIDNTEITDGTITEPDLDITNAGSDGQVLSRAGTQFTWITDATGGGALFEYDSTGAGAVVGDSVVLKQSADIDIRVASDADRDTLYLDVIDDSHNHIITNIDAFTESQLETQTSDVTAYFTNNTTGDVTVSGGTSTIGASLVDSNMLNSTEVDEYIQDKVGDMLVGTETGITVTYQDATADIDFVVTAAGLWDSTAVVNIDSFYVVGRDSDTAMFIVMDTLQDSITVDFGQVEGQTIRIRNVNRMDVDTVAISADVIADFAGNNLTVGSGILDVDVIDTTTTSINHTQWDEHIKDNAGDMVTGNTETGITVTYQDADNTIDFVHDAHTGDVTGATALTIGATTLEFGMVDNSITLAGNPTLGASEAWFGTTGIIFEGATANLIEGLLTVTDPTTTDKTWTLQDVTGTIYQTNGTDVAVADGGTGASTLTDGGVLFGSGTGAITPSAVLTEGQLLIGDGTTDPSVATMSGDATIASSGVIDVTVDSADITDAGIAEEDLDITNAGSDGQVLSKAGAQFTWITSGGGSGAFDDIDGGEDTARYVAPNGDTALIVVSDNSGNSLISVGNEGDNTATTLRVKVDTIDISGDVIADFAGTNLSVTAGVLNAAGGSGAFDDIDGIQDTARYVQPNGDTALIVTSDETGNATLRTGKESDNTAITLHVVMDTTTIGGDVISEFAGTGLTVTSNALTADLGVEIDTTERIASQWEEFVSDHSGAMVTGNTESDIDVVYQDADNTLDFTVSDTLTVDSINVDEIVPDTVTIGGDIITEFAGTGLTVTTNALTADLGTDIVSGEIVDQTIVKADLDTTASNFVFDGAYHITSNIADSAYVTANTINDTAAALRDGDTWTGAHDFGGASSIEIPNGIAPVITVEGQISWDTDDDAFEVTDGTYDMLIPAYKKIEATIWNPDLITDTIPIFYADSAIIQGQITITSVEVQTSVDGTYALELMSFTAADPPVFHDWIDTLNVGASDQRASSATFEDANAQSVDVGQFIYINTPATDIDWIRVSIRYYISANN